ncbi:MAG TPA: hypothetical protein PLV45_03550 [bacterium]|nr:hypothetical protein [bacterium]
MESLLNEVKLLPGVMGSFVYSNTKGVLASNLPTLFRNEALKQVGALLGRIYKLAESTGIDVSNYELKYEEALLMIKQIDKEACFVVVCEPSVSFPLVNMTTSMLVPELKAAVVNAPAAPVIATPETRPSAQPAAAPAAAIDPDKLLKEGPLAPILQEIKVKLAHAIGPIANLVMSESLETWCGQGPATRARLKALADILVAEIGDQQLEATFRSEIKDLF